MEELLCRDRTAGSVRTPTHGDRSERVERFEEFIEAPLDEWLSQQTRDGAVDTLTRHRVPCAAIRSSGEALLSEQASARSMRRSVYGESDVSVTTVGTPIRVDGVSQPKTSEAPLLDGDRDWVLNSVLGLTAKARSQEGAF